MDAFFGSWKLVSSENFDEYMNATGFSGPVKEYMSNISAVVTYSQDGDNIVIKTKMTGSTNRSITTSFKLGEEFDEVTVDFKFCKTVFNLEGGKLIQLRKWDDKEVKAVNEIQDEKLIMTLTLEDIVSVVTYERI